MHLAAAGRCGVLIHGQTRTQTPWRQAGSADASETRTACAVWFCTEGHRTIYHMEADCMLMENNQRVTQTPGMGINLRWIGSGVAHFHCSVDPFSLTKNSSKDTTALFPSSLVMGRELSEGSACLAGNFGGTTYFLSHSLRQCAHQSSRLIHCGARPWSLHAGFQEQLLQRTKQFLSKQPGEDNLNQSQEG